MRVAGSDPRFRYETMDNERMENMEETLDEQLAKLTALAKQNPVPVVLGALGLGLLLGIIIGRR